MKQKIKDEQEIIACGWWMAASNLAMNYPDKDFKERAPKWSSLISGITSHLSKFCDSDQMWDDMQPEIDYWVKLARRGDKYTIEQWRTQLEKMGVAASIK